MRVRRDVLSQHPNKRESASFELTEAALSGPVNSNAGHPPARAGSKRTEHGITGLFLYFYTYFRIRHFTIDDKYYIFSKKTENDCIGCLAWDILIPSFLSCLGKRSYDSRFNLFQSYDNIVMGPFIFLLNNFALIGNC